MWLAKQGLDVAASVFRPRQSAGSEAGVTLTFKQAVMPAYKTEFLIQTTSGVAALRQNGELDPSQ